MDPYVPPSAEIRDSADPSRHHNAVIAFATSFGVLYLLAFWIYWSTDDLGRFRWIAVALLIGAFSTLTGAVFLLLKRMPWYWVGVLSPLLSIATLAAAANLLEFIAP